MAGSRLSRALCLLILLSSLAASGCIFSSTSAHVPEPHVFTALVEINGMEVELELGAATTIPARDGREVAAYPLVVTDRVDQFTYFLDGNFRIVGHEFPCDHAGEHCSEYYTRLYIRAGGVAPFGVGLPHAVRDEQIHAFDDWPPSVVAAEMSSESGSTIVTLPTEGLPNWWPKEVRGRLEFADGRLVPTSPGIVVTEYERHSPLETIPGLDFLVQAPESGNHGGMFYPGSNENWTGKGIADDEFYKALQTNEDALAVWNEGCLYSFSSRFEPFMRSAMVVGEEKEYRATLHVLGPDNAVYAVDLYITDPALGERGYSSEEMVLVFDGADVDCEDLGASPSPVHDVAWAYDRWQEKGHDVRLLSYTFSQRSISPTDHEAGYGDASVTITMLPPRYQEELNETGMYSGTSYHFVVNIHHGWLETWRGHPDWFS